MREKSFENDRIWWNWPLLHFSGKTPANRNCTFLKVFLVRHLHFTLTSAWYTSACIYQWCASESLSCCNRWHHHGDMPRHRQPQWEALYTNVCGLCPEGRLPLCSAQPSGSSSQHRAHVSAHVYLWWDLTAHRLGDETLAVAVSRICFCRCQLSGLMENFW